MQVFSWSSFYILKTFLLSTLSDRIIYNYLWGFFLLCITFVCESWIWLDFSLFLFLLDFVQEKKKISKEKSCHFPWIILIIKQKLCKKTLFTACSLKQNEPLSRFLKEKFDRSIYRFNLRFEGYFLGQKKERKRKERKQARFPCEELLGFVGFLLHCFK